MKFIVAACPLSQIFQEKHHGRLMEAPESMFMAEFEGQKITIDVLWSSGRYSFTLGQPYPIDGRVGTDKCRDSNGMMEWLCGGPDGGRNQETDMYGIADIGIDDDTASQMTEMIVTSAYFGKKLNLPDNIKGKFDEGVKKAAKLSEMRVMREIKNKNDTYEAQVRQAKEAGHDYIPSTVEWLCRYAIRKDIESRDKRRKAFMDTLLSNTLETALGREPTSNG